MTAVLVIFLLVLLISIWVNNTANRRTIEILTRRIDGMVNETIYLRNMIKQLIDKQDAGKVQQVQPAPPQPQFQPKPEPKPETKRITEPKLQYQPKPQPLSESQPKPQPKPEPVYSEPENWFTTWLKNNPDLEKFIGENLINKIGIAVLVLGIAFFVKYAIGRNWVSEVGRVSIGLFCGVLLIVFAHRLRNSYRSFSSVLAGGSIAVFYFTIAFAFHQYHIINQTAAFILMVVITAFAVLLSVLYNRLELAVIATIGGFLTPFIVSTGEGNYIILFTYIVILNVGLLSLSYFKRWPSVNIISFFFTVFIFGGWLISIYFDPNPNVSFTLALVFATAFYLIFLGMNMLYQVKNKLVFKPLDFSILLLLNAAYYAAGMILLSEVENGKYQGLFTLAVGVINLSFAWYFFHRQNTDKNFLYLLIGLTLTFLSLTVPVQLEGHTITMFWSAEFVLLFWLYQKSRLNIFHYSSLAVSMLAIISLMMDWGQAIEKSQVLILLFTGWKGIVTNLVAVAAFALYATLINKEKEALPFLFSRLHLKRGAWVASVVILYLTCIYSVNLYFVAYNNYDIPNIYHRLITILFVLGYFLWLRRTGGGRSALLPTGAMIIYLCFHVFSVGMTAEIRNEVLRTSIHWQHLLVHWSTVLLSFYLLYFVINTYRKASTPFLPVPQFSWLISLLTILLLSIEAHHLFVVIGYRPDNIYYLQGQYAKGGLTILWTVSSFALMWLGMQYRNKNLRIISLCLFAVVLVKLFFTDLVGISEAGKIAAFILLGILLLTVSFMYQRLKKIIIEDAKD